MQKTHLLYIFFSIMGLLFGIIFLYVYAKPKNKQPSALLMGISWLLIPILIIFGTLLDSDRMIVSAFLLPIGLFLISLSIDQLIQYKKCNCAITAEYVSFTSVSNRGVRHYTPQFSFHYNGEDFVANCLTSCSESTFKTSFKLNKMYNIYIDPHNPNCCVDKRFFPTSLIVLLIFGIVCFIFGIIVLFASNVVVTIS